MLQKSHADCVFLLQFIVELLSDDQMEVLRSKEDKKRSKQLSSPLTEGRRASDGDAEDAITMSRLRSNTTLPSINRLFNPYGQAQGPAFSADPFDTLANAASLARSQPPAVANPALDAGYLQGVVESQQVSNPIAVPSSRPSYKRVYAHAKSRSIEQEPTGAWRTNSVYSRSSGPTSPSDPDSMETDGAPTTKRRLIDPAATLLSGLSDAASTTTSRTQSPTPAPLPKPQMPPTSVALPSAAMFPMPAQYPFAGTPFGYGMPPYGYMGPSDPMSGIDAATVAAASMFPMNPMFSPFASGLMFPHANPYLLFAQPPPAPGK